VGYIASGASNVITDSRKLGFLKRLNNDKNHFTENCAAIGSTRALGIFGKLEGDRRKNFHFPKALVILLSS